MVDTTLPIVLTTDFGVGSPAVGVMKGVILSLNPRANVIDLTHQIGPQNIRQGAFIIGNNHPFFPSTAIHVAVVDPGVGTSRNGLLVITPRGRFVAPDNGLLTNVVWPVSGDPIPQDGPAAFPEDCVAYRLSNPKFWLDQVSNTFHGRDVFSPVAAHLSLGVPAEQMGPPVSQIHRLAVIQPFGAFPGTVTGQVLFADHFGNLWTNISADDLDHRRDVTVLVNGRTIQGLSRTFHDETVEATDGLIALIGSHGYLEIAVRDGSAADLLQAGAGEPVQIIPS